MSTSILSYVSLYLPARVHCDQKNVGYMCVSLEGDHKTYIFFKNLNTFARFIFGFIIFRTLFLKLSSLNIYIFHQLFSCCFILKTLHLAFFRDYSFGSAKVLGAVFLIIVYKSTASYVYKLQVSLEVRFCDCGCVHASENIDLKLHFMLFDKVHQRLIIMAFKLIT